MIKCECEFQPVETPLTEEMTQTEELPVAGTLETTEFLITDVDWLGYFDGRFMIRGVF